MKRSRSALRVENGIDFPVLGRSGELIRYSLVASSSTLEGLRGLWCPLPVLLLCVIEANSPTQPLLHLLSQEPSSERGKASDKGAEEALEGTALGSGMCEQRSDHYSSSGSLPSPVTAASGHPGELPAWDPASIGIQSHEEKEQTRPRSKKQAMEAEIVVNNPGYRPHRASSAQVGITICGGDRMLRERSSRSGLVPWPLHLPTR